MADDDLCPVSARLGEDGTITLVVRAPDGDRTAELPTRALLLLADLGVRTMLGWGRGQREDDPLLWEMLRAQQFDVLHVRSAADRAREPARPPSPPDPSDVDTDMGSGVRVSIERAAIARVRKRIEREWGRELEEERSPRARELLRTALARLRSLSDEELAAQMSMISLLTMLGEQ